MTKDVTPKGSLPSIIRNDDELYKGDLRHYFRVVYHLARNNSHPYHNFRHMMHVTWLCYQACLYYRDKLNRRGMRSLLVAAMMHDFDHTGMIGSDDDLNIEFAVRGLKRNIAEEDKRYFPEIASLIKGTEYPHKAPIETVPLRVQILREADMSQSMSVAWIQQINFGLAGEARTKPIDILRMQPEFHRKMRYHTEWGKQFFKRSDLDLKSDEAEELLELLEPLPPK